MAYRYEGWTTFHPILQFTIVGLFVIAGVVPMRSEPPVGLVAIAGLVLLIAIFGRLRFRVDEESVTAEFGFLGWPAQRVPLASITRARSVSYRPILQFGGWGIRTGKLEGERTGVYSLEGNRGVLLELSEPRRVCITSTRRFLLGTSDADRLAAAIGKP
ncbi:MAG TPA: hypothetical protein VLK65_25050 [Vicinamibacteria bacterium]|nr:hypothetical protein [Vicinamibacteria bacterium]